MIKFFDGKKLTLFFIKPRTGRPRKIFFTGVPSDYKVDEVKKIVNLNFPMRCDSQLKILRSRL